MDVVVVDQLVSELTRVSQQDQHVELNADSLKALAVDAVKRATFTIPPIDVLKSICHHKDYKKLKTKCLSPLLIDWLENEKASARPLSIPDAVAAKAWSWTVATRELRKVNTVEGALNALSFLSVNVKGYGLVWGEEMEAEVLAVVLPALEHVLLSARPVADPVVAAAAAPEDMAATIKGFMTPPGRRPDDVCAQLEVGAEHFQNLSPAALERLLAAELERTCKRGDVLVSVHKTKPSALGMPGVSVKALLPQERPNTPASTDAPSTTAKLLVDELRSRRVTSNPHQQLQERLECAVASVRVSLENSSEYVLACVSEAICAPSSCRTVYGSKLIGQFIGKGGREVNALRSKLKALVAKHFEDAADCNVELSVVDGTATVQVTVPRVLHHSEGGKESAALVGAIASSLKLAKAKIESANVMFARTVRRRPSRIPHLVQLRGEGVGAPMHDYVWGKKVAREARYNRERKRTAARDWCGRRDMFRSSNRRRIKKFSGVVQDLDADTREQQRSNAEAKKDRHELRTVAKRQAKLAKSRRELEIAASSRCKSVSRNRSRAREQKMSHARDFVVR